MLCRKLRQTLFTRHVLKNNVQFNQCLMTTRLLSRLCIIDSLLAAVTKSDRYTMSFRLALRNFSVTRLWSAWTRSFILNTVVKRCRRERSVREVIQCFRQTLLRPRRTLLLSATAAYKSRGDDNDAPSACEQNITDEELEALVRELEGVEELSRTTLFCSGCEKRLVIDRKHSGVPYCGCRDTHPAEDSHDGWMPYMEAEDVIIWRKEYKPGQGLYAYKVYGRYKEVRAQDFAAVQVDGAYRRVWDAAVAALSVVEQSANGVVDQAVIHWEVLWPRLFANRDYVYIRRHKTFEAVNSPPLPHKDAIFDAPPPAPAPPPPPRLTERPSVHANAKRKAMEEDMKRSNENEDVENKVYIIISRSCEHPQVPETKHAIRVSEYWSHMVVKTTHGSDKPGMEFVLTYYDEPAVGGLPSGVASWATGRAAPAYLDRMRRAAADYTAWRAQRGPQEETPEFISFTPHESAPEGLVIINEEEMESSKHGPDLENGHEKCDRSTQTEADKASSQTNTHEQQPHTHTSEDKPDDAADTQTDEHKSEDKVVPPPLDSATKKESLEGDSDRPEEDGNNNGSWWRYLYPFYYFV